MVARQLDPDEIKYSLYTVQSLGDIESLENLIDNGIYPDQVEFEGHLYLNLCLMTPDELENLFENFKTVLMEKTDTFRALKENEFFGGMSLSEILEFRNFLRGMVYQLFSAEG